MAPQKQGRDVHVHLSTHEDSSLLENVHVYMYQVVLLSFFLLLLHTRVVLFVVYLHRFEISVLLTSPSSLEMKFCRQFPLVSVLLRGFLNQLS